VSDVIVAFDDYIHGTTPVYSSSFIHPLLAELEGYAIQAIVDGMASIPTTTVTIQIETSGDGRNWSRKNPTAEITTSTTAGVLTVAKGSDMAVRPGAALIRFVITLSGSPGTPSIHLTLLVTPRNDPRFSPERISGCQLFLRADLGITFIAGGGNVASWRDMSRAGHSATSVATQEPAYNNTLINGMPTLFFDASGAAGKIMNLAGSLSLSAAHMFLVAKSVNATAPSNARSGLWRFGNSGSISRLPFTDGQIYDDFGSSTRYSCGTPVATITNPYCYEVRTTSSDWKSFLNGMSQFSSASNTVAWSGTLQLGGYSASNVYFDAHVAEVILYDHILSSDERTALVSYLNARYALGMT